MSTKKDKIRQIIRLTHLVENTIERSKKVGMQIYFHETDREFLRRYIEALSSSSYESLLVDIWDECYSEEAIDGMLNFYESEAGKEYSSKMPELDRLFAYRLEIWRTNVTKKIDDEMAAEEEQIRKMVYPPKNLN